MEGTGYFCSLALI